MKTIIRLPLALTLGAALSLGLTGCGKNESVTATAEDANKAASSAADAAAKTAETAKVEAQKAADAAKAEAAKTAEAAKAEAAKVADAAKVEAAKTAEAAKTEAAKTADNAKTLGLIERAKGLIADGKFADASSALQQLTGQTLSADQTKLVESLKEQIQKALAAKAASGAAGDLLKQ
jgi:hypothetical protein